MNELIRSKVFVICCVVSAFWIVGCGSDSKATYEGSWKKVKGDASADIRITSSGSDYYLWEGQERVPATLKDGKLVAGGGMIEVSYDKSTKRLILFHSLLGTAEYVRAESKQADPQKMPFKQKEFRMPGEVSKPTGVGVPSNSGDEKERCRDKLKQIGLSFRKWSLDYGGEFPCNVSRSQGGVKEMCSVGADGFDANGYLHFTAFPPFLGPCTIGFSHCY